MTNGEAMGIRAHPAPDKPSPRIARQPILAADESVIGYELLFRHNADERHFTADADSATRAAIDTQGGNPAGFRECQA